MVLVVKMNNLMQETEQQILSKELKEDKKLELSNKNFKEIIENSVQPIDVENVDDKLNALNKAFEKPVSYPNNYVFTSLLEGIYRPPKELYTKDGQSLHGKEIFEDWKLLTVGYLNSKGPITFIADVVSSNLTGNLIGGTNGYSGAAYWNSNAQQVIIAHSGTKNYGCWDTNFKGVFLNQHVAQIDSAITFTDKVVSALKEVNKKKGSNIQLFITGHSLGAWLAPITAFSTKYLEKGNGYFVLNTKFEDTGYHATTVIFDGPGCRKMLERIQDFLMDRYSSSYINSLDITNYLSAPNIINACNLQVGDVYRIFIHLSEEDKRYLQKYEKVDAMYLGYTFNVMHKIVKIKEVFDHETGEVLKDENENLRIKRVRDWPLLISGDEEAVYRDKAVNVMVSIFSFWVPGGVVTGWKWVYKAVKGVKYLYEFQQELRNFFKLANKSNDYDLNDESTSLRTGGREIRYRTEYLSENYKNECSLNSFTKPERKFLERYKFLERFQDDSQSSLEKLFDSFKDDKKLVNDTMKMLNDCRVEKGILHAKNLQKFVPYIKLMLFLFPEIKTEAEAAYNNLPRDIYINFFQLISSSYLKSIKDRLGLEFEKNNLTFLNNNFQVLHVIQSHTLLGTARICQASQSIVSDYKEGKCHTFLNLDRIFLLGEYIFISFLKKINYKYLLVIECDDILDNKIKGFFEKLFKTLQDNHNANAKYLKVILTTEKGSGLSNFISEYVVKNESKCQQNNIEVGFNDLTSESQKIVLEKIVIFQGREVPLSKVINKDSGDDLHTIIDPETIGELVKNKRIEIGKPLPRLGETEDYYIDRKLVKKVKVEENALRDKNLTDFFAISNISEEELSRLVNQERVRSFKEEDPNGSIRFIALECNESNEGMIYNESAEKMFKNLCDMYSDHTIHWLEKVDNVGLIWQRSNGKTLSGLRKYIENYESNLSKDEYSADNTSLKIVDVVDISEFDEKLIVIAAEPGMGKTTALTRLGTQKIEDSKWLIRINLVEHKEKLEQVNYFSIDSSFLNFLLEDKYNTALKKKLLESRLRKSDNVVLLLDGFDEITSEGQKNIVNLLKKLQEQKDEQKQEKIGKVFISTRLHLRNELENRLSTVAYTFKPFFEEDQEMFLQKFWKRNLDPSIGQGCLDNYINKLLKFISKSIGDKERALMGIPLQIRMIAEAFEEEAKKQILLDQPECTFPENFNILKLFDFFLYTKYRVYFGKRVPENSDLDYADNWLTAKPTKVHRNLALKVLFPKMVKDFIGDMHLPEQEKQKVNLVGIAQFIDNRPVFTHRTFCEYFAADFLAHRLSKDKDSQKYKSAIKFLAKELFENKNEVIKTFLDYRLAKVEIHVAVLKGKLDDVENIISEENVNITDNLGRSALHYAAQEDHRNIVDGLLSKGVDVRTSDKLGKTALHYAARYNKDADIVDVLLKNRININAYDSNNHTAVYYAAEQGNWDIVDFLVMEGANDKDLDTEMLLFHYTHTNSLKGIKSVLAKKKDITKIIRTAKDNHDNTLLHIAAGKGNIAVVEFFLEKGADVGIANKSGKRPINYAAEKEYWGIAVSLLMKNANLNHLKDKEKHSLLKHSAKNSYWGIVKLFMEDNGKDNYYSHLGDKQKLELLCHVILFGDFNVVEFLMKQDIAINNFDEYGIRPISYAASKKYWNIVVSLVRKHALFISLSETQQISLLKFSASYAHWDIVKLVIKDGIRDDYFNFLSDKQKMHYLYYVISIGFLNSTRGIIEKFIEEKIISDVNISNNCGKTFLHLAAQDGKLNVVQYLVDEKGADVNAITYCGSTPLHLAARNGHLQIVKYLANEKKASFDVKNNNGSIPLHLAAESGKLEVVNYLIDKTAGFEVDRKLHWAVRNGHLEVVKLLIETGHDLNSSDENGDTPLHLAICDLNMVKLLVESDANVNSPNNGDFTPVILAIKANKIDVVRILIEKGADLRSLGKVGYAPIHFAAGSDNLDLVKLLVEKGADINSHNKQGFLPILYAIKGYNTDIVKFLIEKGADLKFTDNNGSTLMHFVVSGVNRSFALAKLLIESGADFKSLDKNGATPLYLAVRDCKLDVGDLLIDKIHNLFDHIENSNLFRHKAITVSDEALQTEKLDIVRLLIEKGADFKSPDKNGFTHVHFAAGIGNLDLIKLLVEKGADFKTPDNNGYTPIEYAIVKYKPAVIKFFVEKGFDFKSPYKDGLTLICLAVISNNLDIVKFLIEKGANVNDKMTYRGLEQSLIHIAALKEYEDIVELLINNGVSINDTDAYKNTPLHTAVYGGKSKAVKYLISKGANVNAKNYRGSTPADIATKEKNWKILHILNSSK